MHYIDGQGTVPTMPTPEPVGTPGFFAAADAVPPTQVTGDFLNSTMMELINAALIVDTLDKTDNTQLARAIRACILGGPVGIGAVTTEHLAAVAASTTSAAFGLNSLVAASINGRATGDQAVCLACDIHPDDVAGGVVNGECAAAIGVLSSGNDNAYVDGDGSVLMASFDGSLAGNFGLIAASGSCRIDAAATSCAILASEESELSVPSGNTHEYVAMLASYLWHSGSAAATSFASRKYMVTGGYSGAPSWRIESNGGTMRSTAAHTTSGLDYAELFENGDKAPHAPGRLLSRKGKRAHLAQPGDRILGAVSVSPTVVGGDDGLAWSGRYERDEWGAIIWEDVEVEREVDDREAVEAYKAERARLQAAIREADTLENKRALAETLAGLETPARITEREQTRQMKTNPAWDPAREQVPRSERPDQWTVVGLLGQIRIAIGADVSEGDMLMPGVDGVGAKATRDYLLDGAVGGGARVEVMEITSPFDAERGYGIAICLVR